ncbi:O-antigen ligase family protein [Sinomonas atrocyanea]|uniref:O-antigen ligase family protein n=1 Tax=Sinomonas atrocyanea TaxID=37927 RepID=UPI003D98859E
MILVTSLGGFQAFAGKSGGQILYSALALAIAMMSIVEIAIWRRSTRIRHRTWWPIGLAAIPAVSTFWSEAPTYTLPGAINIALLALLAVWTSRILSLQQIVQAAYAALVVALLLSAVAVVIVPTLAIDVESRGELWQGIFNHKNSLGRAAALMTAMILVRYLMGDVRRPQLALALLLSTFFLWKSGSQTATLGSAMALLAALVISRIRRSRPARSGATLALFAFYVAAAVSLSIIGPMVALEVGRDETLTGRTVLWALAEEATHEHPFLGFGFNTIWAPEDGVGATIASRLTFRPSSAHNGLLDLRLQFGWLGALAFLTLLGLGVLARARRQSWRPWSAAFILLSCILTMDLAETSILFGGVFYLLSLVLSAGQRGGEGKEDYLEYATVRPNVPLEVPPTRRRGTELRS